jgi:argininosuccinate lyase
LLSAAYEYTNQNPLGAAAAFGTNLPVDRDFTTRELEFSKPMINCLYTQNSRGKIESFIASTMVQVMLTLGKVANDMVLFTTQEFPFFAVDDSLTTGSSIMPQKKNLDIMEVLRANVSSVIAAQLEMQTVHQNLMSGYNKDLKITKPAVMKCFELTLGSIEITNILFQFTTPKEDCLRKAFMPEIFATDVVNNMVKDGATFREAYVAVGDDLDAVRSMDLDENLKSKTHLGAPGNLGLDRYDTMLDAVKADLAAKPKRIESRWS